jgi:hypothetical protein
MYSELQLNRGTMGIEASPLAGVATGTSLYVAERPTAAAYDEASLALWMIGAALVLFKLSLVIALCTISGQSGRWRGEDISESPPGITPAGALERPTDERPDAA